MFYIIMKISLNNSYSFKSGLSEKDVKYLSSVSSKSAQKYFKTRNIEADFKNNDTYGALNLICGEILKRLGFLKKPGQIVVFNKEDLLKPCPDTFCSAVSKKITKNNPAFKPVSLFFQNDNYGFRDMNEIAQNMKKDNFISSDNFLTLVMHEWAHSLHFNYLYSKLDTEEEVKKYLKNLNQIDLTKEEKEIIAQYLGNYVYNNGKIKPTEVMAEGINKIVCSTLSENELAFKCGIKEALDNTPRGLLRVMKKILNFKL